MQVKSDEVTSNVEILFEFCRYRTSHLVQTFLPSFLLVLASLLSLWIPSGHVPGRSVKKANQRLNCFSSIKKKVSPIRRMTLSITITLTLMSMMNSVTKEAPRTSYLKALDIWMGVCFVFTFLVLVEYCLVLYLSRTKDWYVRSTWAAAKGQRASGAAFYALQSLEQFCLLFSPSLFGLTI